MLVLESLDECIIGWASCAERLLVQSSVQQRGVTLIGLPSTIGRATLAHVLRVAKPTTWSAMQASFAHTQCLAAETYWHASS